MIYDRAGELVFFRPARRGVTVLDFRPQTYQGQPVLTWWEGTAKRGYGEGSAVIYDQRYQQVARVRTGNGQKMDFHEFTITPENTALTIAYRIRRQDLRGVRGGKRNGLAMQNVVQEIDIPTGAVLMEWDANRSIAPQESYERVPQRAGLPFDYIHLNSATVDADGGLLLSARATHTIYKLDRRSGKLIWRLGGKRSSFRMGPGARTRWQHDAHRLPDGTITAFDNNADEPIPGRESRGVQLRVDERRRRATLVRQWTNPKRQLSPSQGNMQTLPNGNVFVGWGGTATNVTELTRGGSVQFESRFARRTVESYRGYLAPWTGQPISPPRVAARVRGSGTAVRASWNGATTVASWRVLAGPTAENMTERVVGPRRGFETELRYAGHDGFATVEALDAAGNVLSRSRPVPVGKTW